MSALSLKQRAAAYEVLQEAHLRALQPVKILLDGSVDPRLATDAVDLPRLCPACGDGGGQAAQWLAQCGLGDHIPILDDRATDEKDWDWLVLNPTQLDEGMVLARLRAVTFEQVLLVSDRPWQPTEPQLQTYLASLEAVAEPQPGLRVLRAAPKPVKPINKLAAQRILVITNLFPPQELGGYGRSIADFAMGLANNGHTVEVLTSDAPYLGAIAQPEPSVERSLQLYGTYEGHTRLFEDQQQILAIAQQNFQQIKQAITRFQPTVCLVGNVTFLGSSIFYPLLERNIPVIHHLGFASPPYPVQEYPQHPLYHLAVASDYVRDRLVEQQYPVQDSITVYPSALVREFYQPTLPPRDRLRICYAGLVISSKGVHTLVESLQYLKNQGIEFDCSIAGDAIYPEYKQGLEALIQQVGLGDRVTFVGFLNRQALIPFHQRHNVLVFPSISDEAFGITQVEAMAAGLTLITTGVGGAGEVIDPGISGLKFTPEDPADLAKALISLVQNPEQWERLSRQGQRRALEKFDIQSSVAQLELQFQQLLDLAIAASPAAPSPSTSAIVPPPASKPASSALPYSLSSRFMTWLIDQLNSCLTVYQHAPQDENTIGILREMRKQVTQFWLSAPADALETLYGSPLGTAYQKFLHSGFQQAPLTAEEQQTLSGLTQTVTQGLEQPGGINALLGLMLHMPAEKMQVRDAENRLPQWLLPDYQKRFAAAFPNPAVSSAPAIAPPTAPPIPTAPTPAPIPPGAKPLWDETLLNELLGCANLYTISPGDPKVLNRCREARQAIAGLWLQIPTANLEDVYKGKLGQHYLAFLKSGFHKEPLLEPEKSCLQELSEALKQGFETPHGLQALLGIMLYLPPGTMQVRDAATRLPSWLINDYQAIFETDGALPQNPQSTTASNPGSPHLSPNTPPLHQDSTFLNRLLGCLNLYEIDPSDGAIINNLRQLRQQIADIWLNLSPTELEATFASDFGQRYCAFLKSGFQREPLTDTETQYQQKLTEQISTGIENPPGLKALLGGMLYFSPGSMQVSNAQQRLPQWLFPHYQSVFEP